MSNQLTTTGATTSPLAQAGQAANRAAGNAVFVDYRARKSPNTLHRQDNDLALFRTFLQSVEVETDDLTADPMAWRGVTWGIVRAFQAWQLQQGYAIASINARLSTVKIYAKLAAMAGAVDPGELALIRAVGGYAHREQKSIDAKRLDAGIDTRVGDKKAASVSITAPQARQLKEQPNTPQGRRDRLALCLMLDLGLRVGEVASLTVDNFNLAQKTLTFYREKVNKVQTMALKNGLLTAARAWFDSGDAPAIGSLWRGSRKDGQLQTPGWTTRGISKRVNALAAAIGIDGLSPHDLRHYWATAAARNNTPMDRLQDAGGWSSLAMPARYIESAKIANDGVNIGDD